MNTFLLILAGWILFGLLGGCLIILEFKINNIKLSNKNKRGYFLLGVYWGYISFVWAVINITKTLRKK